mmetsp:Transcript_12519/g.29760  ORF Transcript_12519/g.29760 Transcript_12519/m.29760 type:complete len:1060 (-) Transcript_12519:228-3407(-)
MASSAVSVEVLATPAALLASHKVIVTGTEHETAPPLLSRVHEAAWYGDTDALQSCLGAGDCVDAPDEDGNTPLHLAAKQDHREVTRLLLESGADAHCQNMAKKIPLDVARMGGRCTGILWENMEWRAQIERKQRCFVQLQDGTTIGDADGDRLVCWFTPMTCQVHFELLPPDKSPGCLIGCFTHKRRAKSASKPWPCQSYTLPIDTEAIVTSSLTVDVLVPSTRDIPPGAAAGPLPRRVVVMLCLALDVAQGVSRMLRTFYAEAMQVDEFLRAARANEITMMGRIAATEEVLAEKRRRIVEMMKRGPSKQGQAEALEVRAEAGQLEKSVEEMRLSISSEWRKVAACAAKAIAKFEARDRAGTAGMGSSGAFQLPLLRAKMEEAFSRNPQQDGGVLAASMDTMGSAAERLSQQSPTGASTSNSSAGSPSEADSISFFAAPPCGSNKVPADTRSGTLILRRLRQSGAEGGPAAVPAPAEPCQRAAETRGPECVPGDGLQTLGNSFCEMGSETMSQGFDEQPRHDEAPCLQEHPESGKASPQLEGKGNRINEEIELGLPDERPAAVRDSLCGRKPELRQNLSVVVQDSVDDLDAVLLSTLSVDKSLGARRLTRHRPTGMPLLDLHSVNERKLQCSEEDISLSDYVIGGNHESPLLEEGFRDSFPEAVDGSGVEAGVAADVDAAAKALSSPREADGLEAVSASVELAWQSYGATSLSYGFEHSLESAAFLTEASTPPNELFGSAGVELLNILPLRGKDAAKRKSSRQYHHIKAPLPKKAAESALPLFRPQIGSEAQGSAEGKENLSPVGHPQPEGERAGATDEGADQPERCDSPTIASRTKGAVRSAAAQINARLSAGGVGGAGGVFPKAAPNRFRHSAGSAVACNITRRTGGSLNLGASDSGPCSGGGGVSPEAIGHPKPIKAYPSRRVSGPSGAQYDTHPRVTNASCHLGLNVALVSDRREEPSKDAAQEAAPKPSRMPLVRRQGTAATNVGAMAKPSAAEAGAPQRVGTVQDVIASFSKGDEENSPVPRRRWEAQPWREQVPPAGGTRALRQASKPRWRF